MAAMLCGEAGRDHSDDGLCPGSFCPPQLPPSPTSLQVRPTSPCPHTHPVVTVVICLAPNSQASLGGNQEGCLTKILHWKRRC